MHRQNYQRFFQHTKFRPKNMEARPLHPDAPRANNQVAQPSSDMLLNKLSLVGEMSSCLAHGIRNPLTTVRGFAQLLAIEHPEKSGYYQLMMEEIDTADEVLKSILSLAKDSPITLNHVMLNDILSQAVALLFSQIIQQDLNLYVSLNNDVCLYADEEQLVQCFVHILKNSIEASPEGSSIFILSRYSSRRVQVTIIDKGSGIKEQILDRIMEPFFTTKEANTGLGLSVAYKIIQDHGGKIKINSCSNEGTIVEIILPLSMADSEAELA